MTTKRIDALAVACCLIVGLFCAAHISGELKDGSACEIDLDQERALRMQAEQIEMKLIKEASDEWCRDSIASAYDDLEACEKKGPSRYPEECGECWNAWTMDMAGSCDYLEDNRCSTLEDAMFVHMTVALWEDYVYARIEDCKSRDLKTREEREKCMGPAMRSDEVQRAFEAISIHQESKARAIFTQ